MRVSVKSQNMQRFGVLFITTLLLAITLLNQPLNAQEPSSEDASIPESEMIVQQNLMIDQNYNLQLFLGSIRPPYPYLSSMLIQTSPVISEEFPMQFQLLLRGWGVLYFVNVLSTDLSFYARYHLQVLPNLIVSPLIGVDVLVRNHNDVRSTAQTMIAPVFGADAHAVFGGLQLRFRLSAAIFSDGIILLQMPEVGYSLGIVNPYLRIELAEVLRADGVAELRMETYLGVQLDIEPEVLEDLGKRR